MALGKHTKTKSGRIRRERNDTKVETLQQDYAVFEKVRPGKTLGDIKKQLNLPPDASLNEVIKNLKNK